MSVPIRSIRSIRFAILSLYAEGAKRVLVLVVVITLKPSSEAAYSQAFRSQTSPFNQDNSQQWVNFQIC